MSRPKYKTLYQDAKFESRQQKDRADVLARELQRVRGVLAQHGKSVVEKELVPLPKDAREIRLSPLNYVAYESLLLQNARICTTVDAWPAQRWLAWRGTKVLEGR